MLIQTIFPYSNFAVACLLPTEAIHRPRQPLRGKLNYKRNSTDVPVWLRRYRTEHAGEGLRSSARQNDRRFLRIIEKSCTTALVFYRRHNLESVSWGKMVKTHSKHARVAVWSRISLSFHTGCSHGVVLFLHVTHCRILIGWLGFLTALTIFSGFAARGRENETETDKLR